MCSSLGRSVTAMDSECLHTCTCTCTCTVWLYIAHTCTWCKLCCSSYEENAHTLAIQYTLLIISLSCVCLLWTAKPYMYIVCILFHMGT